MGKFLSVVTTGNNKLYYFNYEQRKAMYDDPTLCDKSDVIQYFDSHAFICKFYKLNGDLCNKYEIDPFNFELATDQINTKDDSAIVRKKIKSIDLFSLMEYASLDLRSFISLPDHFKLPATINGYLYLNSLTPLPDKH
jgi:hypothetical protein